MVYTTLYKEELLDKLEELDKEEVLVGDLRLTENGMQALDFSVEGEKEQCDETIAQILSDMVQKQAISHVCKHYLEKQEELSVGEQSEITESFMTNNYLSRQEGFSYITYYLIYLPILEELKQNAAVNIEGWLRFRTQKYKILLRDLLEQFIADYAMKKDVITFIKILREVSTLSVPLEEVLHLVYDEEDNLQLYNKKMKNVTAYYMKKYCRDLLIDSTLSKEDFIMNILITVCPKSLVVHQKERAKKPQFLKTLEVIFDMNIKYCKVCSYCSQLSKEVDKD